MSIEKKSLISTLKTTKKVNAVSSELNAKPTNITAKRPSMKRPALKRPALKRPSLKRPSMKRPALKRADLRA